MENHTDIETLLTKYFEGKTTPPENEQIEAWLNADEEHLHIAPHTFASTKRTEFKFNE